MTAIEQQKYNPSNQGIVLNNRNGLHYQGKAKDSCANQQRIRDGANAAKRKNVLFPQSLFQDESILRANSHNQAES